jgi:membrane-bound metal-dependent hydrolase YbcI (DUF457 family)
MDIFTHALTSVAVVRAATPRAPRTVWIAALVAGTISDIDDFSVFFGPSTYFTWYRTFTHSIAFASIVAVLLALIVRALQNSNARTISTHALLLVFLSVVYLHLALDACQSTGLALLWPFKPNHFAADYLAHVDPWIIAILLAAILFPELLHLVGDEIGSKEKRPRGRLAALVGLIFVFLYVGARATLHSNALAAIQARSYRGESPHRTAAFPESVSLFTWRGIAETDSAIHELTVNATPGSSFDPETLTVLFKPDSSPALERARDSAAAKRFLAVARFPKATLEKTPEGYSVQLRDLRYAVSEDTRHETGVLVKSDSNGNLLDDSLVWTQDLRRR